MQSLWGEGQEPVQPLRREKEAKVVGRNERAEPATHQTQGAKAMTEGLAEQLLASLAAGRLVVFAGAGLSMAPPSNVPSATALAEQCAL